MNTWTQLYKIRIATTLIIAAFLFSAKCFAQEPFIPKYDAVKRSERCFSITLDDFNQFGAVWFKNKGDFSQDTTLYFVVYMGERDDDGADGLSFVMHDDPRDTIVDPSETVDIGGGGTFDLEAATGDDGGGLGYAMHESRVDNNDIPGPHPFYKDNHRIWPSVAIELDTWDNGDPQDGADDGSGASPYFGWDHTSVVYDGDLYNQQQIIEDADGNSGRILPVLPESKWGPNANIEDNNCYAFKIEWNVNGDGTQTLQMWADNYVEGVDEDAFNYTMVMTHTDDMLNGVFGGETQLRFGFTGSTGGSRNEQTICLLGGNTKPVAGDDYASTEANNSVEVNVEDNDQDFDGDNLFIPIIVSQPSNGTAQVITQGDENLIEYTPNADFTGSDTVTYKTCDVDSDKCYALCDSADVIIDVGCNEFNIGANEVSPYTLCDPSLTPDGVAEAFYVDGTSRGDLWLETFNYPNGTTSGGSPYTWSASYDNTGTQGGQKLFYVEDDLFRARTRGSLGTFETQEIDISNVSDVDISVLIGETGNQQSDDSIKVVYILDGGQEVTFDNGVFVDDFGSAVATAEGLNGSTLKIKIYVRNTEGGSQSRDHYWDDLHITATGPVADPGLTYHWHEGSITGDYLGTGTTMNQLKDTTYYIYGVDPNTGCRSDTVSVTISNEPAGIDSIYIDNISPLTKCTMPYDGELEASVIEDSGGQTTSGYTFEWWESDFYLNGPAIRVGSNASNLEAKSYRVRVTSQSTGCQDSKSDTVSNSQVNPTVDPEVLSHITNCDNPTGSVFATAEQQGAQMTSDVTFNWYDGNTAPSNQPADYVGDTISGLDAGDYAVRAENDTTGCESSSANVTINDNRNNPVPVVTNATDQTSCDPDAPTGSFTSAVEDGSGGTTTDAITFNWYKGLNDVTPAHPGYTGGPDVDSLEADQYRLIVENDTTGCTATLDTAIIDDITIPVIDNTATTDVTVCGPGPNGTITITPDGTVSDYTYRVYAGNGVNEDSLITDTTSTTIGDLDIGNYTVTIVDKVSACESDPEFVSIGDARVTPTATFSLFHQVSCDSNNPTGRIEATVDTGTPNDYTFEWFEDNVGGTPVTSTRGTNGEILDTLDVGTYALRITNDATLCENTYYHNINEDITLPVIDTAYTVPSTYCGTAANGELHATADGGQTDPSLFTFNWTEVSSGSNVSDQADVFNISPEDYELVLVNDTTTCTSDPYPVTVDDNTVTPMPTIDATNNSSCDVNNPNGSLEVTDVPNESPFDPNDYSFEWYVDNSSGTQLVTPDVSFPNSPDSSLVTGLAGDDYAVVIYNKTTNCSNEVLTQITDINIKPVLDYPDITDATRCTDPYMSRVEVTTVNGGDPIPAGYSFSLENISTGDFYTNTDGMFEDLTDSDGIELPVGDYELVAYNSFNCPSDTIVVSIGDNSTDPIFSLSAFDNTSCDVNLPNGIVETSTDGTYGVNQVEWFIDNTSGSPVSSISTASIIEDDTVATGLPDNTYAVRVTANNGCTSVEYASVSDVQANQPLIDSVYAENLTSCVINNGEIGLSVDAVEQLPPDLTENRTYTFTIENTSTGTIETLSTDPASADPDTVAFVGLEAGDWEAVVVDEYSNCVSDPITITIQEAPEIVFDVNVISNPSGCVANTGHMEITVETPGSNEPTSDAGFDFRWFEGTTTSGTPVSTVISPPADDWTSAADQLTAGYYTIEVTDRTSQCIKDTAVFLNRTIPPIIDNVTVSDATKCDPADGGLEISIDNSTFPPTRDYDDYDYLLFEGRVFDEDWNTPGSTEYQVVEGTSVGDPVNGPVTFASTIEAGTYVVVGREKFGDNCFTDPEIIEVELDFDLELNPALIVSDSSCTGGTPTGELDASYNDFGYGVNQVDVDYEWFEGTTTSTSEFDPAPGAPATVTGLVADVYTVQLEVISGAGEGCVYDETISLPKIKPDQVINASIIHNRNCAPYNGEVTINDISVGGSTVNNGNFENFQIFDENNNEISVPPNTDTNWTGLAPGSYYLSATKTTTQCVTEINKVDVIDESEIPAIDIAMDSQDYSCDDLNPTGQLTATATNVPMTGTYSWDWTNSAGTNIAYNTPSGNTSEIVDQQDDVYTVEVTDNDGDNINDGCSNTRDFTITQGNSPVITPIVSSTPQTICVDPNGSIIVDEIQENRDDGSSFSETPAYADYSASLFDDQLNTINTGSNPWASFQTSTGQFGNNEVPVGTYYVRAQNITNGCDYGPPTQVIIKDVSKDPVVQVSMIQPDYSCDPAATPTGELATTPFGGTDNDANASNFDYTWRDSGGFLVSTDGGTPPNAIELREGTYTIEVVDDSGVDLNCSTKREFTVTHKLQEIVIVETSSTDQTWCDPNGTFQIDSLRIIEDGVTRSIGESSSEFQNDYEFDLYEDDFNTEFTSYDSGDGFPSSPYTGVPEGTYFAVATNDGTLCESVPRQVVIDDVSEDPLVDISVDQPNYSLNYDNINSLTGIMTVEAFEADGVSKSPGGYNYKWYRNTIDIDSLIEENPDEDNAITRTNMRDAIYHIKVTDSTTSCEITATQMLPFVYLKPYFNPDITPQTTCVPANGEIEIPQIQKVSDSTETFDKYKFSWYMSEYVKSNPDSVKQGGNTLQNLEADNYYVQALDTFWMVESDPVKVVLPDSTKDPKVNYNASVSKPQTSCNPDTPNGVLSVVVEGFDPNGYGYAWFAGDAPEGDTLSTTNTVDELAAGTYTVIVTSRSTGCTTVKTYDVEDDIRIPVVAGSTEPVTNCPPSLANGIASANIINVNSSYEFYWYKGIEVKDQADIVDIENTPGLNKTNSSLQNIQPGFYTVVALDTFDCKSDPVTIEVKKEVEFPVISVEELAPLTYCDPEKPNAIFSARADGQTNGYTFEWFVQGGSQYNAGPNVSNLGDEDYLLVATNNTTGCSSEMPVTPTKAFLNVPNPLVDIIRHRTSCIDPNGIANSGINTEFLENYEFNYLEPNAEDSLEKPQNFTEKYELDIEDYFVYAKDRISGCISDTVLFTVDDARYTPDFEVISEPSLCTEPTGGAEVVIGDLTKPFQIQWYDDFDTNLGSGRQLLYRSPGEYTVAVEGTEGCVGEQDFKIGTEIKVYNGVSANGDNLNDVFHIVCLERFDNNNVKIYNRAGELVFEMDNYDRNDPSKAFDGQSNRGPVQGSGKLAIGTYFYVIDKGDGSERKVGYLELTR